MVDRVSKEIRSKNMKQIRSGDTGPEMRVRRILHRLGYRYRLHVRVLPGCPDLVFPGRKKVVFVHGCFWHQHGKCHDTHLPKSRAEYWIPKLQRNVARDRKNRRCLRKNGWDVFTVWECELEDEHGITSKLQRFLDPK
jgi:DNA mismatch endonuclease (patch repair protein)